MQICTCNECQRLDALPTRRQGIPGCRQLVLVDAAQHRTDNNQAQRLQLAAASPMRPTGGRTADLDGLALFDAVRSPSLF